MSYPLLPPDYRPSEDEEFMNPLMREYFRQKLLRWRSELLRDSNGNLRLALNSSMLPPGGYEMRVEGLTWRGEAVPLRRVALTMQP